MDMVRLAVTRRCKMSAATSDSDDIGRLESLERTKPANVTDEGVTDEAKAQIYRGSCGEGKVHIDIVQQEQARRSDRGRD